MTQQNKMRERAEQIVELIVRRVDNNGELDSYYQSEKDVEAILQSLRDETIEECAKIANNHAMQFAKPINREQEIHDAWARRIESKIRSLKTPKPEGE